MILSLDLLEFTGLFADLLTQDGSGGLGSKSTDFDSLDYFLAKSLRALNGWLLTDNCLNACNVGINAHYRTLKITLGQN